MPYRTADLLFAPRGTLLDRRQWCWWRCLAWRPFDSFARCGLRLVVRRRRRGRKRRRDFLTQHAWGRPVILTPDVACG